MRYSTTLEAIEFNQFGVTPIRLIPLCNFRIAGSMAKDGEGQSHWNHASAHQGDAVPEKEKREIPITQRASVLAESSQAQSTGPSSTQIY